MPRFFVSEGDNAWAVVGGAPVPHPTLGWALPTIRTFVPGETIGSEIAARAKAEELVWQLNAVLGDLLEDDKRYRACFWTAPDASMGIVLTERIHQYLFEQELFEVAESMALKRRLAYDGPVDNRKHISHLLEFRRGLAIGLWRDPPRPILDFT
jgi:hypothetical protein